MKRTFLAFNINASDDFTEHLNTIKGAMSSCKIKWTAFEKLHITLKFIGNTDKETLGKLYEIIDVLSVPHATFDIKIKGMGYFCRHNKPAVLWAGTEDSEPLFKLAQHTQSLMEAYRIPVKKAPFKSHITIGRIKHICPQVTVDEVIESYRGKYFQKQKINSIILYESILKQSTSVFIPLYTKKLS